MSTRKLDHRFKRHVANSISRLQLYNPRESSSEKGGLITYVDVHFRYEIILNINEYANWEGQIIKVSGGGLPKSVIICNLYRPPRMLQDQIRQLINELSTVLSTIERTKNDVLLAGDFNINLLKLNENETCSEFFDSLLAHSFLPQITIVEELRDFLCTFVYKHEIWHRGRPEHTELIF